METEMATYQQLDGIFNSTSQTRDEDELLLHIKNQIDKVNEELITKRNEGKESGRQRALSAGDKTKEVELEEVVKTLRKQVKKQEQELSELNTEREMNTKGLMA